MTLELKIGLDAIDSYKRLAYTPWHAIAEFVDNSTQSYFNNKQQLDQALAADGRPLEVTIVYEKDNGGLLRIADNALGMSLIDLEYALEIGRRPSNQSGRSRYGLGMKTAAAWIGNCWKIRTKKLGETVEHTVELDVTSIIQGNGAVVYTSVENKPITSHYTVIEVTEHNRRFLGRTIGKIRDYLTSMYRIDLRNNWLKLSWQNEWLQWADFEALKARDGSEYKKQFSFVVDGRTVTGWVAVLARGTRANAGFAIIHSDRVIKGWPDAWRPETIFGQVQGSNDLVNQRLFGEIHLDGFEVSHTKDDILWFGSQQDDVENALFDVAKDYRDFARTPRWKLDDARGPSNADVAVAVETVEKELQSPEMVDQITLMTVPAEEAAHEAIQRIIENFEGTPETIRAVIDNLTIKAYIEAVSPNDPYVAVEATKPSEVIVLVNRQHPHWKQLKGSDGVANFLRHCFYDAIAEWKARQKTGKVDSDTVKLLKDSLLRVPMRIEEHAEAGG